MSLLFTPLQIGRMRLANRLALTAMVTRLSGEDGHVNQAILDRYVRFAKGEVGLIVLEAMAVHDAKSGPLLRIADDRFLPGLTELARQIHATSHSKVVPQIIHFLKVSRSGWRQTVEMLTEAEIHAIVRQYAAAAYRARMAGMDGVELHMAHAYTLSSFLSKRNGRTDGYGKGLEGRLRLASEVITAVRNSVGDDFAVGVRFLGDECIKGGYSTNEARAIALRLARLGADYISLSAGGKFEDHVPREGQPPYPYTGYSGDRCMPSHEFPDGINLYMADGVKRYLVEHGLQTPVLAAGKIATQAMAEGILAEGRADLIGMARGLLADPDLPKKWREGEAERVVRCIYCNVCKNLDENFRQVRCFLWPKDALHAPEGGDWSVPAWIGGADLTADVRPIGVRLGWKRAAAASGVMGYEIFRSEDGANWERLWAGNMVGYTDQTATAGATWHYMVQAYDGAGNHSALSDVATVQMVLPDFALPEEGGACG
ncbi:MAG TPA: NADH:flavin oxidoreductase [Symbiobacteriaceae bacterium]|nr:NADH:flavin oxidoreductase [Symbiobacteriaceae bacterium]